MYQLSSVDPAALLKPPPGVAPRDHYVFMAQVAEQAERFDDMVACVKALAMLLTHPASTTNTPASPSSKCLDGVAGDDISATVSDNSPDATTNPEEGLQTELTAEERNLLSVAYKNAVGGRRTGWRLVSMCEQRERSSQERQNASRCEAYRTKIEGELHCVCNELISLLHNQLIPTATNIEAKVFYHKMKGDYYRYIGEFAGHSGGRSAAADSAQASYIEAMGLGETGLPPTHPTRLGLALNYSVFYCDILNNPEAACCIAREAFEKATEHGSTVSNELCKDSALILELLRDNLILWSTSTEEEHGTNADAKDNNTLTNNADKGKPRPSMS
eukprot:GHVQ01015024.1.p2 GENE.GHVQ01015024.1~~GHVQ01015024.1.p2  ORF type:complete len:331 (-),score=47.12 GHVQ01015024.1:1790-2782(-)